MSIEVLVFLATALFGGGVMGVVIKSWADKRKTAGEATLLQAQARDVLVAAGERTVEMLGAELDRALLRIVSLERRVRELEVENAELRGRLMPPPGSPHRRRTDPKE